MKRAYKPTKKAPRTPSPRRRYSAEEEAILGEYDEEEFRRILERAQELVTDNQERDALFDEVRDVFWLDWTSERPKAAGAEELKLTLDATPSDNIVGAHRLLTAGEPIFNVPRDANPKATEAASDDLKRFAEIMWKASGKIGRKPVESELALAALLFSQVHIGVTSTADLVDLAPDPMHKARALKTQAQTPYLFESWYPRNGYAEFDRHGMVGYLRQYEMTMSELEHEWGQERVKTIFGAYKLSARATVRDWYDLERRCVYVFQGTGRDMLPRAQGGRPLYMDRTELGFVPVWVHSVEGSRMFGKPEFESRPWLYNLLKSGMWKRANLSLTTLYTLVHAVVSNALYKHTSPPGNTEAKALTVNTAQIGVGVIELVAGEIFEPMFQAGIIDPAILQALEIAERKMTQSTIHRQALGEPLGANAPFSMVALLHQAGRLPLVPAQRMTGAAIAGALEMGFAWLKQDQKRGEVKAAYGRQAMTVSPSRIPDTINFDVRLDVSLAQDKIGMLQQAAAAKATGLVSTEWLRENLLHIGQSEEMDADIWSEQMAEAIVGGIIQAMQGGGGSVTLPGGGGETPPEGGMVQGEGEPEPAAVPRGAQPPGAPVAPLTEPLPPGAPPAGAGL